MDYGCELGVTDDSLDGCLSADPTSVAGDVGAGIFPCVDMAQCEPIWCAQQVLPDCTFLKASPLLPKRMVRMNH